MLLRLYLLFAALFESVEITVNGTVVSKSASLYPIKSYLVDLLTHSSTYKQSVMSSLLFISDTAQDDFSVTNNSGFKKRLEYTKSSSYFDLSGKEYLTARNTFHRHAMLPYSLERVLQNSFLSDQQYLQDHFLIKYKLKKYF
jgi:hypothetical protein